MFALMLAKYNYRGMHEVLIAVRSNLVHFVHESSRCEPNKRGVSPEVGVAPKIRGANFLLETPLFKVWLRPWLASCTYKQQSLQTGTPICGFRTFFSNDHGDHFPFFVLWQATIASRASKPVSYFMWYILRCPECHPKLTVDT